MSDFWTPNGDGWIETDATPSSGGGITNAAGENVLAKGDAGGNLVASAITEASAGALATSAGTALGLTATAPAATTGASQAGVDVTITASPAVASTDTAGAAAGGDVTITAGAADRLTSGNAAGGDIILSTGSGIGTGKTGHVRFPDGSTSAPSIVGANDTDSGLSFAAKSIYVSVDTTEHAKLGRTHVVTSPGSYNWSDSTTSTATIDTTLRRRAAANPAWGAAAASPVAYTHNLAADSRAGTDTNVAGANAIIAPGVGTGNAAGSTLTIQTPTPVASGTGAQTLTTRLVAKSTGINIPGLAEYADNAAAVSGGLVTGDLYRTSTGVLMVVLP